MCVCVFRRFVEISSTRKQRACFDFVAIRIRNRKRCMGGMRTKMGNYRVGGRLTLINWTKFKNSKSLIRKMCFRLVAFFNCIKETAVDNYSPLYTRNYSQLGDSENYREWEFCGVFVDSRRKIARKRRFFLIYCFARKIRTGCKRSLDSH